MKWAGIVLLFTMSLGARAQGYTNVFLSVSAPKQWFGDITDSLKVKLNAIPDVQVVDKEEDAAFTVYVDVNAVSNQKDELIGYSMMALVYGTYDRKVLDYLFDKFAADGDKASKASAELMKYIVSGNVFLAATIHTHGSVDKIDSAYDEIVGQLKTKALPELKRFQKLLEDAGGDSSKKSLQTKSF